MSSLTDTLIDHFCLNPQPIHRQDRDGNFRPMHGESLSAEKLEAHIAGEPTYALNIVDPDGLVRIGVLDCDEGDKAWPLIVDFMKNKVEELGLPRPAVSISGRKGFGLFFRFETPLPAQDVRFLLTQIRNAYFPNTTAGMIDIRPDTNGPTVAAQAVIKLPPCRHMVSNKWSAFMDPAHFDRPEPEQPNFGLDTAPDLRRQQRFLEANEPVTMAQFNRARRYLEKRSEALRSPRAEGSVWDSDRPKPRLTVLLEPTEHPPCIASLVEDGVPHDVELNMANLNLAKYCRSRNFPVQTADKLARAVAERTIENGHPTGKSADAAVKNFRSNRLEGDEDGFTCDFPNKLAGWRKQFGGRRACANCPARPKELETGASAPTRTAPPPSQTLHEKRDQLLGYFTKEPEPRIPSPFKRLNELLHGGFAAGRLAVVVAPPKMGKTTFAMQALDHAASQGVPCLYVGYEMAEAQLFDYALARHAGINSKKIEMRRLTNGEAQTVGRTARAYLDGSIGRNLTIWEAGPEVGFPEIERWISEAAQPPLVVVDYLQLARTGRPELDSHASETRRVTEVATGLKHLARTTSASIIALSSTTKEAQTSSDTLGEFGVNAAKDSSTIINAADTVLTLNARTITLDKGEEKEKSLDPWQWIAREMEGTSAGAFGQLRKEIDQLAASFPRRNHITGGERARISVMRNRGSEGHVPVYYEKAHHRFLEPDFKSLDREPIGEHNEDAARLIEEAFIDETTDTQILNTETPESPNSSKGPEVEYRYITDRAEAVAAIESMRNSKETVGLDIETTGLNPHESEIRLLQLSSEDETVVIDVPAIGGVGDLADALGSLKAVAHNAVFEMKHLKLAGVDIEPDCTMIMTHLLTGHGVSFQNACAQFLDVVIPKAQQKSDWSAATLTPDQLHYAACDAHFVRELHQALRAMIDASGYQGIYELEHGAQPAITTIELNGMPFDADKQGQLLADVTAKLEVLKEDLNTALEGRNPNSGKQLSEWITEAVGGEEAIQKIGWPRTDSGALKTDRITLKKGLKHLSKEVAAVVADLLLPYKEAEKVRNTYGTNLRACISPTTGRIHGQFKLTGTVTGRLSSKEPNLQNQPRAGEYRALFKADDGNRIIKADYSQMELRIAAHLAEEPALNDAYAAGADVHAKTAAGLLSKEIDDVTADERQLAKAVNFGLLYGAGAKRLQEFARTSYGVEMTLEEARRHRQNWFKTYPVIRQWQLDTNDMVKRHQSIETQGGRVRRFSENDPFSMPKALNTPIQGGAADVLLLALRRAEEGLRSSFPSAKLIATVHDEIVVECEEVDTEGVKEFLCDTMTTAMEETFPGIATTGLVEATAGASWGGK